MLLLSGCRASLGTSTVVPAMLLDAAAVGALHVSLSWLLVKGGGTCSYRCRKFCLLRRHLAMLCGVKFLQQEGVDGEEVVGRLLGGEAEVALVQTSVLGLQVHGAVELMAAELDDDSTPDREGRGAGNANDAHDIAGHSVEEPVHEALVLHHPLWTSEVRGGRGGLKNTRKKAELPNDRIEEAAPLLIVGVDDVKDHRHMGLDVHHHEGSGCGRLRLLGGEAEVVWGGEGSRRGRRGDGRTMDGGPKREQRVVVHG